MKLFMFRNCAYKSLLLSTRVLIEQSLFFTIFQCSCFVKILYLFFNKVICSFFHSHLEWNKRKDKAKEDFLLFKAIDFVGLRMGTETETNVMHNRACNRVQCLKCPGKTKTLNTRRTSKVLKIVACDTHTDIWENKEACAWSTRNEGVKLVCNFSVVL